ncbi:MAG: phosphoenolpyruvate carboxylase [Solirubrobacteraceae bacterium]|jgi:phosphoenolpyruvate carboxylase|nr:phosphoenolpyruvate carboxylase [Solirubrobacteraceae bacterium]
MSVATAEQPRTFADDEALLGGVLDDVIEAVEGPGALTLHRRAVELGTRSRSGEAAAAEELAELVAGLDLQDLVLLIRMLTRWFQLINLAEDNDRVRRIRKLDVAPEPRRGSLHEAVVQLAAGGTSAEELRETLGESEVRLVLTAHPTEARRRTTVSKLSRIFGLLRSLDERHPPRWERDQIRRQIAAAVQEMWGSDELRAVSTTVLDEVRGGLIYFTSTLAEVVPTVYRDLEAAISDTYPEAGITVPPLLSFGSWMGGDRDGNPFVTPAMTADTLELMKSTCLRHLEESVLGLTERVTLSARVAGEPDELRELLDRLAGILPELTAELKERNPEEPYRRLFKLLAARVRATRKGWEARYERPAELLEDLHVAERSLHSQGAAFVAGDELRDVIRQVEVFGFHFALLDVREHAAVHSAAIDEILRELDVQEGYAELPEAERIAVLSREISDRRPLIPVDVSGFSASTREVVETFRTIHELLRGEHPGTIQSYIVSGTTGPADLLEVLLLMKEVGLASAGGVDAALRIVPLFESGQTLAESATTMRTLLETPVYRAAVDAVRHQEMMVGYSDSNKDIGYVGSAWHVYRAQLELAEVMREHGIAWQFFHGRGGAVGRGGGPSYTAIRAQPPGTVAGRLKVTEQGEMLSAKFSVPEIAHRELELSASAALVSTLDRAYADQPDRLTRFEGVVAEMAERSTRTYRDLVYGDPAFAAFFHAATPVREVSRLRLGSRPAKRRASMRIEDFRAIPWVFSWTQARAVLPAWYGLGTALRAAREEHGVELLREMERDWPFFAALISNAEMAFVKVDLDIARRYAELYDDEQARERIWSAIEAEFELTLRELGAVRDEEHLLDREPILQRALARRNAFIDPLSFVQLELLRRLRAPGGDPDDPDLVRASLLAINGIAGGLRNTG